MSSGPILLTERELAKRLNVSVRTLQAQRQRGGGFPYLKLNKSVRYDWTVLLPRLSELERTSTSQQPAEYHTTIEAAVCELAHRLVRTSEASSLADALAAVENVSRTLTQAIASQFQGERRP